MEEKKYSQEQVDAIINERVGRRDKQFQARINELGFGSEDEIKNLKSDYDNILGERDQYKNDYETLFQANELEGKKKTIKSLGVDEAFVDYVLNTAEDGNYEAFIEANPKLKAETFTQVNSNPHISGKPINKDDEKMRSIFGLPPAEK